MSIHFRSFVTSHNKKSANPCFLHKAIDIKRNAQKRVPQSVEKVLIPMNGIPKGLCSFGRVQRQRLWWGVGAKGELKNSPVDCFLRGNALQVKAFP